MKYTRLSKNTGCRRYTIGGRTFQHGRWYQLGDETAALLGGQTMRVKGMDLPVFDVLDEDKWKILAHEELAQAMAEQLGGDNIAALRGLLEPPTPTAAPKTGKKKDAFAGLIDAEETSPAAVLGKKAAPVVEEEDEDVDLGDDEDEEDDAHEVDIDGLRTKKSAREMAEEYGVDLGDVTKLEEMKSILRTEIHGD